MTSIVQNNFNNANAWVEELGKGFEEEPTVMGAFFVGFITAVGLTVATGKTSYDLISRSINELSPLDLIGGIAALAATIFVLSVAPAIFVLASAYLIIKGCSTSQGAEQAASGSNYDLDQF